MYIVNKCILCKLDKWSDDVERRHEKIYNLSKLYITPPTQKEKKRNITMPVSDCGTQNGKSYLFPNCLNVKFIPYPPQPPKRQKEERKSLMSDSFSVFPVYSYHRKRHHGSCIASCDRTFQNITFVYIPHPLLTLSFQE